MLSTELAPTTVEVVAAEIEEEFDYSELSAEDRSFVKKRVKSIKQKIQGAVLNYVGIGQELLETKARIGHGQFGKLIKTEFGWSHTSAGRYMAAAEIAEKYPQVLEGEFDFALKALETLNGTPEAIEEAVYRARNGEKLSTSSVKAIVAAYKGTDQPEKRYIYKGETVSSQMGDRTIELTTGTEVYPASASLTDPTQAFVRIVGDPKSCIQVNRSDLELIEWDGWRVGDRAKLLDVEGNAFNKQFIGDEVEVDELKNEGIQVSVVRNRGAWFDVVPEQLSRNLGLWRHIKGLYLLDSIPPRQHKDSYVRVDTLPPTKQAELSRQRVELCFKLLEGVKSAKKRQPIEEEIKKEEELQTALGFPPQQAAERTKEEQALVDKAIRECGLDVGDYIEDLTLNKRGFVLALKGILLGTPKDRFVQINAQIKFHDDSTFEDQAIYFKRIVFKSLSEVGLSDERTINAKELDLYIDKIGWQRICKEWAETSPEERQRVAAFFPGLQKIAERELGQEVVGAIIKADDLYFDSDSDSQIELPDSLFDCQSVEQVLAFCSQKPEDAAAEFCEADYSLRNKLRAIADVDTALISLGFADGLLLADRDNEITVLKDELQRCDSKIHQLDEENLKLEGINGDLHLEISELKQQLKELQEQVNFAD